MLTPDALCRLVNEFGTVPRAAAHEQSAAYPDPRSLGAGAHTTDQLVRTADLVHPVFAAPSPQERVRRLDDLVRRAGVTVRVSYEQGEVVDTWVPRDDADALLVAALRTIRAMLAERGVEAIGVCDGDDCADAWIDRPRGRPRRYCSTTCAGRARAAAHRRRRREESRS